VCFLAAEFPVQFLTKRYGFRWVLPSMMLGWSTVSWAQAWMNDRTSFYLGRAFIGLFEGGFIPGVILFSTYFYKSKELAVRLALFWSTLNVARVVSALLAAGILEMRGIGGKPGWFWLFLLEGLLTFVIGALSYLYLPASPTATKNVLWPNGYYTEREEVIMVNVSLWMLALQMRLINTSAFSATTPPKASQPSRNPQTSGTSGRRGRTLPCGDCI
jgi:hypothetical protein